MQIKESINYYFELFDYLKHNLSEVALLPPMHIYIEPSNVCNLNCPFCATSSLDRTKKLIDMENFKRVIEQIVDNNWHTFIRVTLTGQGEPLINKNILEMISYAKAKGIKNLEIINNATLMNKKIAKEIIDAKIDRVQFSIDSLDKAKYDILRASKNKNRSFYYDAMQNILNFLKINDENGHHTYVSISSVQTSLNKHEKDEFLKFWNQLPVDNIYLSELSSLQDNSPMEEAERFTGDIKDKQICLIPWITLSVKADGNIVICSHDYHNRYPVGNIKNDKLIDVWNNEKSKKLRKSLINADLKYFIDIKHNCEKCNNPCLGFGKDDFVKNIPIRMEKTILGSLLKDKTKISNLSYIDRLLEEFKNKN